MTNDTTVLMFLLIIIVAMSVSSPQNYTLIVLIGLLATALWKYQLRHETFADSPEPADGDAADMAVGQTTRDFDETKQTIDTPTAIDNTTQWDNTDTINRMFAREPEVTDGDQRLFDQMKNVAMQPQDAILARARFTSDNFRPLVQQELDEQEKRDWWEDDTLDTGLVKDGQNYTQTY